MNKKITISKIANKVLLGLVYFLFFIVQLHFQYQSASSVDFIDNSIVSNHAPTHSHIQKSELKQDVPFAKHNRLNKRYHPEWPIAIVDFFEYQPLKYQFPAKQYFSVASNCSNVFLFTYQLRGPPTNV